MKQRGETALEIRDLHKAYGSRHALRGISFSLEAAARLAFLGPNGAGKTTMIRCLCGRTHPDAGSIQVFGNAVDSEVSRRLLGVVPQEMALYEDLTAAENLKAFGRYYGLSGSELRARVKWALDWTGLADRRRELVARFSGGMKRRINLACGVLHHPRVLLLDEPTVGVDPQSRERIFHMLDEINREGTAILLTTHHLDEAQQRSERIIIVDQGRVVADGTIDELLRETVGESRIVQLRIDRPLREPIHAPHLGDQPLGNPGDVAVVARVDDVSTQLSELLHVTERSGYRVADLEVRAPSLHHVFLHLTGHELRD